MIRIISAGRVFISTLVLFSGVLVFVHSQAPPVFTPTSGPTYSTVTDSSGTVTIASYHGEILPALGTGVAADATKTTVTITCGTAPNTTTTTVDSSCIYGSGAAGRGFDLSIKVNSSAPCNFSGCSTITVTYKSTTGTTLGTATMSSPTHQRAAKVSWGGVDPMPADSRIVSILVTDATGSTDVNYTNDIVLTISSLAGAPVTFSGGATSATIAVANGVGAVRIITTAAASGDIIYIEASGSNLDTARSRIGIQ